MLVKTQSPINFKGNVCCGEQEPKYRSAFECLNTDDIDGIDAHIDSYVKNISDTDTVEQTLRNLENEQDFPQRRNIFSVQQYPQHLDTFQEQAVPSAQAVDFPDYTKISFNERRNSFRYFHTMDSPQAVNNSIAKNKTLVNVCGSLKNIVNYLKSAK